MWEVKMGTRFAFNGFINSYLMRSQRWNYVDYIIKGTANRQQSDQIMDNISPNMNPL